jgi:hypothetical protein
VAADLEPYKRSVVLYNTHNTENTQFQE